MKPETKFRNNRVVPYLKKLDKTWFTSIQAVSHVGLPDIIGVRNGKFFALELKKDEKAKRGKLQKHIGNLIVAAGGFHRFCYPENFDEVKIDLEKL